MMNTAMPMPLSTSKASDLDTVHTPKPVIKDLVIRSPDSGYESTATTRDSTPQCDQDELKFPTGKLLKRKIILKVFQEEIPRQVNDRFLDLKELFERPLYERLVSSGRTVGRISTKLKILGESKETSAYWLVIQCEPKMARHVRQFFNQEHVKSEYQPHGELKDLPSFKIWVCPEPPMRLAMDSKEDEGNFLEWKGDTFSGTLVKVRGRMATVGGVILVRAQGQEFLYCLTVGHVMSTVSTLAGVRDARDREKEGGEERKKEEEGTEEGEGEGEEEEDLSDHELEACWGSEEIELDYRPGDDLRNGQTPGSSEIEFLHPKPIGIVEGSKAKTRRCFDWALTTLKDEYLYRPNCRIRAISDKKNGVIATTIEELKETKQRSTRLAVSRRVVVLGGVSGSRFGDLSGPPSSYVSESSTGFVQMYTLTLVPGSALKVGDCGSWVVDEKTNEVYGHVVASDIFGEVYIAPLKETLKQIEEVLWADSVSLPTKSEVDAWIDLQTAHVPDSRGCVPGTSDPYSFSPDSGYSSQTHSPQVVAPLFSLKERQEKSRHEQTSTAFPVNASPIRRSTQNFQSKAKSIVSRVLQRRS